MKASEIYGSKYTNASDLGDVPVKGTITELGVESMSGEGGIVKKRVVIGVEGFAKPLVVNSSNATRLAEAFGDDLDDWLGCAVEASKRPVRFGNKMVPGVHLEPVTAS